MSNENSSVGRPSVAHLSEGCPFDEHQSDMLPPDGRRRSLRSNTHVLEASMLESGTGADADTASSSKKRPSRAVHAGLPCKLRPQWSDSHRSRRSTADSDSDTVTAPFLKNIVLRRSCRTTAADLSGNHRPQSLSLGDILSSSYERGRDLKLRAPPYPIVPVMIQSPPDSGKSRAVGGVRIRRPPDVKYFTHVSHHSRASYSPRARLLSATIPAPTSDLILP